MKKMILVGIAVWMSTLFWGCGEDAQSVETTPQEMPTSALEAPPAPPAF